MATSSETISKSTDEKLLAFKTTIAVDTHETSNELGRGLRTQFPLPAYSEDDEDQFEFWDDTVARVMTSRCFAITSGGLMGLVPSST